MEALIAKGDALGPPGKKRKISHKNSTDSDKTLHSVVKHTSLPRSYASTAAVPENVKKHTHIANKKLRTELYRNSAHIARSKALLEDAELLLPGEAGLLEAEGELERTWRVSQSQIVQDTGQEAGKGRSEWKLDDGPYRSRYTRNGRYVCSD
jgi:U3 small nucleolar RNA-associated protein 7